MLVHELRVATFDFSSGTMIFPEFVIPLTPQDLPAEQTYKQINASLSALQQASDGVFACIQDAVKKRRGM